MVIQHKNIPNAQLHEPKGVNSASTKMVYLADGLGSGEWRVLSEAEFNYATKANNRFGWNLISDSLYTNSSKRAISSAARTQITNNGLLTGTDTTRLGSIWNVGSNLFRINDLNAVYDLRLTFKVTAAAVATSPYNCTIELEGGAGPTGIASGTLIIKGGGAVNHMSYTTPFALDTTYNDTNLRLYITPDTNIEMYDIEFLIRRAYRES